MWLFNRIQLLKFSVLLLLSLLLISCEAINYYAQAARGQLVIMLGRENIQNLLANENLSNELEHTFIEVNKIKQFAESELGLPLGENYSTYVDVNREYVVWNVFAAPEFSTDPLNWCYPIAGCVSYRGYFSEASALRYAGKLEEKGLDVYVGGVAAYSTLGWFEDSLLSTVISRSSNQIARLIFHELAHQIIYVPGDTAFNESFATAVEREGMRRWLEVTEQTNMIDVEEKNLNRHQQFVELIISYRDKFTALYKEEVADQIKRQRKLELQTALRNEFANIEKKWGDYGSYDVWFSHALNNAQLSTVASYNTLVPFFNKILLASDGDLNAFYIRVAELAELDKAERVIDVKID